MPVKAVGLFSGGLDSILAAKLMLEQNIEVHALYFIVPFFTSTIKNGRHSHVLNAAKQLGDIPLKCVTLGDEFLNLVQNPKYGYGKGLNPCIDCRIFTIKKALSYMKEINGSFIFTGEVLGQRPMSQHRKALEIINNESGSGELILRPLSAGILAPTLPEQKGWVDRNRLLAIMGRSRKKQIALAREKGILDYPTPAGGCLLTDKNFAERLKDYFAHTAKPTVQDMYFLKIGRHFRLENGDKVIVARNESECKTLESLCREEEYLLIPDNFSGPSVVLQGEDIKSALAKLLEYTHAAIPKDAIIRCVDKGKRRDLSRDEWV